MPAAPKLDLYKAHKAEYVAPRKPVLIQTKFEGGRNDLADDRAGAGKRLVLSRPPSRDLSFRPQARSADAPAHHSSLARGMTSGV